MRKFLQFVLIVLIGFVSSSVLISLIGSSSFDTYSIPTNETSRKTPTQISQSHKVVIVVIFTAMAFIYIIYVIVSDKENKSEKIFNAIGLVVGAILQVKLSLEPYSVQSGSISCPKNCDHFRDRTLIERVELQKPFSQ